MAPAENRTNQVTVVIINFNGLRFLDELLAGLAEQSQPPFETVLIDNASQDDSPNYVRNNYPWVKVKEQDNNLGFSKAANLGIQEARTEFCALLNTDIKVERRWLEHLVAAAENDQKIAAVASKIRLYHEPTKLNGVGGSMNRLGYTWDRGMFEEDEGQFDRAAEVLFASAGAALFRRSTFIEAGGFDERFFMYHEDVDLCWRLWILGHRVVTAPQAVVYHHFGASTKSSRGMQWRELIGERNNIRSLIKNYRLRALLPGLLDLLLLPQPFRRKLHMFKNFLWNLWVLPGTLKRRRWIQKNRRRTDRDLEHLIVQSKNVPISL